MKSINIVELAGTFIDGVGTKKIRAVIADRTIEFFTKDDKTPDAVFTAQAGAKIVDADGIVLGDGEYKIGPATVAKVKHATTKSTDKAATVEKAAAKSQDKTTRSASPVTAFGRTGI